MDSEKLYRVQEEDLSKLEELLCRSFAADPLYLSYSIFMHTPFINFP